MMTEAALLEQLAEAEHAGWSRWMEHLFSKCDHHADGSATLPAWAVDRWMRQAATAYDDLTAQEQESDRDEVRHILPLIRRFAGGEDS